MKSPQHTSTRRNRHALHPYYHSGTRKNRNLFGARAIWYPEQIVGRLFDGEIDFSAIYRWIYVGLVDGPTTVLRQKGKRRKPVETRGRFNVGLSISKRSSEVRGCQTFGHWELDIVVSRRYSACRCISPSCTRRGSAAVTRTPKASCASSSRKDRTSRRSAKERSWTRSPRLTATRKGLG